MKKVFDYSIFITLFIIIGYFVNSILLIFLAKTPPFYFNPQKENSFYNISLSPLFFKEKIKKTSKIITPKKKIANIKNFKLKAIYGSGKNGFIIINDNSKNIFINYLDKYKGYKLIKINITSAIFEKNNHKYILAFKQNKKQFTTNSKIKNSTPLHKISKTTIQQFTQNSDLIWQNIGITKTTDGYIVVFVKPNSIFDKLGLKKGDILVAVNGRHLSSDSDAWNLYRNRNNFTQFHIEIIRNNQTKVLNYEVY